MSTIRVLDGFSRVSSGLEGINEKASRGDGFSRSGSENSFTKQAEEPRESGFSRVDRTGEPGSSKLQGLELNFTDILSGFKGADDQDLEEWDFLVTMNHPSTLNGIQNLQGKKERKARKEKRAEKKANKPAANVRPGKAKRKGKQLARQTKRTTKGDIKLAKKQERVLKRASKRETREKDHAAKRLRKSERGKNVKEIFAEIGDKAKDVVSKIVTRPGSFDESLLDMQLPESVREEVMPIFDRWQDMDPEDVLDERTAIISDEDLESGAEAAKPAGASTSEKGGGNSGLLLAGAAGLLLLAGGKKKGKKKK